MALKAGVLCNQSKYMAEFKFFCPRCGQQILCDTGYSGTQINCPACKQVVVVPQALGSAAHSPVPLKSRVLRNVLLIAALVVVLAGLIAAGWFGYSKYKRGHLPSGLVALWSGEGNANDSVGANNGTLVGDVDFADGKVGQAFSFNGRNSCVSIPDSPLLDSFTNCITITLWLKAGQTDANPNWKTIVSKGNAAWEIQATVYAKTVSFFMAGPNPSNVTGRRNVQDGQWHHVAAVYDGANICIYVDGTLDVSTPATGSIVQNSYPMGIGYNAQGLGGSPGYFYNGMVDEVSLYHRALSASEIQAIYLKQK
jgi:hypothetical protein